MGAIVRHKKIAGAMSGVGHAFRWTSATGMVDLGSFGDDNQVIEITGMSGDGSVIVGHAMRTTSAIAKRAYRWTYHPCRVTTAAAYFWNASRRGCNCVAASLISILMTQCD
jgi:uncharacterized membrane protein